MEASSSLFLDDGKEEPSSLKHSAIDGLDDSSTGLPACKPTDVDVQSNCFFAEALDRKEENGKSSTFSVLFSDKSRLFKSDSSFENPPSLLYFHGLQASCPSFKKGGCS